MEEEIHSLVPGPLPTAKPGLELEILVWRPLENLRPGDKPKGCRLNSEKGLEALIDSELKESDLVLNNGLDYLVNFHSASPPPKIGYGGVGTDATAPAAAQSNLIAEVMRVATSFSKTATVGQGFFAATFNIAVSGYALNECGLANMSGLVSGIFYCRDTYATKNTLSGDTVNLNYTMSFSAAG